MGRGFCKQFVSGDQPVATQPLWGDDPVDQGGETVAVPRQQRDRWVTNAEFLFYCKRCARWHDSVRQAWRRKPASRSTSTSSWRNTWRRGFLRGGRSVTSWSWCWSVCPKTPTWLCSRRRSTLPGSETTSTRRRKFSTTPTSTSAKPETFCLDVDTCLPARLSPLPWSSLQSRRF